MKVQAKLERQIAALRDLSRDELAAMWEKQYGCSPKGIKRVLLERSAAWHLQARRLGGLSSTARRMLKAAEKDYLARQENSRKLMAATRVFDGSGADERQEFRLSAHAAADRGTAVDAAPTDSTIIPTSDAAESATRRPSSISPSRPAPIILSPGTRLLREWNGRMYAVDVLDKGFAMDGKTYRSLSAVAKRITGAEWSGPRFFKV